jgi:hypothetical protein
VAAVAAAITTTARPTRHPRRSAHHAQGLGNSFQVGPAAVDEADARKPSGQTAAALADEDLTAAGKRAQPCSHIESGPTKRAVLELDRLARVDPDAHAERQVRIGLGLLREDLLEVHRCSDRLARRVEHGERLVTADLDQRPAAHLQGLLDEVAELRG